MQLPFMNLHIKASSPPPPRSSSSSLHHMLNNPNSAGSDLTHQGYHHMLNPLNMDTAAPSQFTWIPGSGGAGGVENDSATKIRSLMEAQGLSLSLSSSLRNMEAAKLEVNYLHNQGLLEPNNVANYHHQQQQQQQQLLHSGLAVDLPSNTQVQVGYAAANVLRGSRYLKPAQELLEEFCCVGRGHFKNQRVKRNEGGGGNPNSLAGSSSSKEQPPPLSAADRSEFQRRKIKLLSMLDEACHSFNFLPISSNYINVMKKPKPAD